MNNFLNIIAKRIYKNHKAYLNDVCIVFPNNRAALFFNKYLTQITTETIWKPKYTTINKFIYETSNYILADDLYLIFELYKVFKKVMMSNELFDSFYFWGKMILNDFNDIDKNNLSAKDIYTNLRDIREIDNIFDFLNDNQKQAISKFWQSFEQNKDSDQKKQFKSIWENLYNIYVEFNSVIKQNGTVYEGVIYKELFDKIKNYENLDLKYNKIIFVGLNALNTTEFKLLDYLNKQKKAEFYWDIDKYYINNNLFEAGNFIRQNSKILKPEIPFNDKMFDNFGSTKNIDVYSISSNTGQAKIINNILAELKSKNNFIEEQTAIVLADEELLVPVLNSIPEFVDNINVTMGYPLKNTQTFGLINNLLKLWKETKTQNNENVFYYKNVLSVLHHSLLNNIEKPKIDELKNNLTEHNITYIKSLDIKFSSDILQIIFNGKTEGNKIVSKLLQITSKILELADKNQDNSSTVNKIEKEILFNIYLNLNRLNDIIETEKLEFNNFQTYVSLINTVLSSISVPFTGEPLKGLQIMGILETRTLDFKNVIILSLNEGILPKVSVASSFIPYNLRKGFGLPTIENQDSIFSYYFYRLIQRAENITLVYNSEQTYTNTGEASRFIKQLQYESNKKINFISVENNIAFEPNSKIEIQKNNKIKTVLTEYFTNPEKYLSPSAINTYLDCGLRFYFRYVAKIKEPDQIIENIDSALFGTIFHKSIELIYEPFLNKLVNSSDIEKIITEKTYINNVNTAFANEKIKPEKQALITYEIIKENILQTLQKDKQYAPFTILHLEKDFKKQIEINFNDTKQKITIKGNIDRVDKIQDKIRIIDYKTGKTKQNTKDILSLFDELSDKRQKAIMQTMIYAMAYKSETNHSNLFPSVYQIKELYSKKFDYKLFIDNQILLYDDYETEFETNLKNSINQIFDEKQSFKQTENKKNCEYCEYKKICY